MGRSEAASARLRGGHDLLELRGAREKGIEIPAKHWDRGRQDDRLQPGRHDGHRLQAHPHGLQAGPRPRDNQAHPGRRDVSVTRTATTRELASFLARLRYEDVPDGAVERTKELFLDWLGSALAGKNERPVRILERIAGEMGPSEGPSEVLISRRRTTPLFAALVNGAASHVEQDDLHNASVFHPATVVFPAALAAAQQTGASGSELIAASVVGYEAGVRVGSYLGRTHYRVFHTTGTAGALAAAAAVSHLLGSNEQTTLHALGSAGTQAGPGCGSSCATPPTPSSSTPPKPPPTASSLPTSPTTASPAHSASWRGRGGWPPACPQTPTPTDSSMGLGKDGRCSRPRSSTTPPAATPTPRPTPYLRGWRSTL